MTDAFVLPVDKPAGKTSHDVVYRVRKALGIRRVGHTGTLDPFATGLLLVCVGTATRISEYLTGMSKCYSAVARLGVATDTEDVNGDVVSESDDWRDLSDARIEEALDAFRGTIDQVPPQYSAKKVDGERMHRRARRGETVALEPRQVTVSRLDRTPAELPALAFDCCVSSGTYVRSLARDIGDRLGVGAHLSVLRRTSVGDFDVGGAVPFDQLENVEAVAAARIGPLAALAHLPAHVVDAAALDRIGKGQRIGLEADQAERLPEEEPVVLAHEGRLVAIGDRVGRELAPRKVFPS